MHAGGDVYDLLSSHSLPMDLSRPSLERWDSRRWNYNWRDSLRCGRGSGISRQIQNLVTVLVRPPPSLLPQRQTKQHCTIRCAIASTVQVYRSSLGRFHSGAPLPEELCAFCPRLAPFDPLRRLLAAPSSACSPAVHPFPLASPLVTPSVIYAGRVLTCDIQARRYLLKRHERNARSNGGNGPRFCSDWGEHGCPKVELARILDVQQGSSTKDCTPGRTC